MTNNPPAGGSLGTSLCIPAVRVVHVTISACDPKETCVYDSEDLDSYDLALDADRIVRSEPWFLAGIVWRISIDGYCAV